MAKHVYRLGKLVRDSSIDNMQDGGAVVHWHKLDTAGFKRELALKLLEEGREVVKATDEAELASELADILEIVESLAAATGVEMEDVRRLKEEKRAKRGGFDGQIYVDRIECEAGSFWDEYCAKDPEKYGKVAA